MKKTAEYQRLMAYRHRKSKWKHWGPYLSERAWGTVREDYSPHGTAWEYFPHDHARSRAYRWNEDGLAGISDRQQYTCLALALWNGRDPILKERLFGLTGSEGNHGEDVKEYYYYLDSTPTHSYMKMLYKYPQAEFPYEDLVAENGRLGYDAFEYELLDTGVFAENRYFDVFVEYAKADENDILMQISAVNRGPETAVLHLLPTLWYRNTWSWGYENGPMGDVPGRPELRQVSETAVSGTHPAQGSLFFYADNPNIFLFTENETNNRRLFGTPNASPYVKDAFHQYIVHSITSAVNVDKVGTKVTAVYQQAIPAGATYTIHLRLTQAATINPTPFAGFEAVFAARQHEADEFYAAIQRPDLSEDEKRIQRQAFAGMLWSKQLYYFDIPQWLDGDPENTPPDERKNGRNHDWRHLNNFDVISMPDKWEYPWYAAWDLAFHCIPLAMVDADFAKRQLILITREWYMHPNGQLPAYEWAFGDVNPPVHAWAAWRVYRMDARQNGEPDRAFLEAVFHKLLLNFTWWVNRKDEDGNNIFQGGFLGLDNISIFDRSGALPTGGHIDQADGTAWMGFFSLEMLRIALELAQENPVYQDVATKFFEHFLSIATAVSEHGIGLWDEEDGFYYDHLHMPNDVNFPLKVRSLVGLLPLIAVEILEPKMMEKLPDFNRRVNWFLENRPHLSGNMHSIHVPGRGERRLAAIVTRERLESILRYMLDQSEFLSPYGIRSLSKYHEANPYNFHTDGQTLSVPYWPAESRSGLFGGNSNWRGPIWFPINYLLIEALQKFHSYYEDDFLVEYPTGSGTMLTLADVAAELARRLIGLFKRNEAGKRPFYGGISTFQNDPYWRDLILFNEYFHGDNGAGLGAGHQTGWTGLIAELIQQAGGG